MQSRRTLILSLTAVILISTSILAGAFARSLLPSAQATHIIPQPHLGVWNDVYRSNSVSDTSIVPGTDITFSVNLTDVVDMNGFDVKLRYNIAVLQVLTVTTTGNLFDGRPSITVVVCPSSEKPVCDDGPSAVEVSQVLIGETFTGTGFLFKVTFRVLIVGLSQLDLFDDLLLTGGTQLPHTTQDGVFSNSPDKPPVAYFEYGVDCARAVPKCTQGQDPLTPIQGQVVVFNASRSMDDPSNSNPGIALLTWNFGEPTAPVFQNTTNPAYPIVRHIFRDREVPAFGDFTVTLTAKNKAGLESSPFQQTIRVAERLFHDVVARSVDVSPNNVVAGAKVTVTIKVLNQGTSPENVTVKILRFFDPVGESTVTIDRKVSHDFQFTLDTTGLQPAIYQIGANAAIITPLSLDENPTDNTALGFFVVKFPLPTVAGIAYVGGGALLLLAAAIVYGIFKSRQKPVE